jgi:hypothetical protein
MHIKYYKVFLLFRDINTVKDYYNIEFHVELSSTKTCENLLDQRQKIVILNCNSIKGLIVHIKIEFSTRFFSE